MMSFIKLVKSDIKAVESNPILTILTNRGFHSLLFYRISHILWKKKVPLIPMIFTRIIQILYSIDIDWRAEIDGGCCIVHGTGLVIGQGVKIGENVKIYHGVTLGIADNKKNDGYPHIKNNCLLGAGAKLLGNLTIGENCKIGANAVVIYDIPPNCVAVGIPAKIIKKEVRE